MIDLQAKRERDDRSGSRDRTGDDEGAESFDAPLELLAALKPVPANTETELAFAVPPDKAEAVAAAMRQAGAQTLVIHSHYFDTPDRRLATAKLALRLRRTGDAWEQTLKAPAESGALETRHEHTVARPGSWGEGGPPVDPRLHDGSEAARALASAVSGSGSRADKDASGASVARDASASDAAAETGSSTLAPSLVSRIERQVLSVPRGSAVVEVAFDRGDIQAGERTLPVCEIELELKSGDAGELLLLARETVLEFGAWRQTLSKSARGDRLRNGDGAVGSLAVGGDPPVLRKGWSAHRQLQAMVAAVLTPMVANAGALTGSQRIDEEVVHQLRVAIRRYRGLSREVGWMSPRFETAWEQPLADVFRVLGRWRDNETVAVALSGRLADAGSPAPLLRPPARDLPDPTTIGRAAPFQLALLDLMAFTRRGTEPPAEVSSEQAKHLVAGRLDKLFQQVEKASKTFGRLDDDHRHRVRKRLKRLRYLAEAVGPLHKRARVSGFLKRLKPAQDALGEHVDLLVGLDLASSSAQGAGDGNEAVWFNVGWIKAALPPSVRRCKKELGAASRARPFWKD